MPLSRDGDFWSACVWHSRFSDRQVADADGGISWMASEKCSRLGLESSKMLCSWSWDTKKNTTSFEMHQGAGGSELRSRNSAQPMFVNQRSICCDGLAEEGRSYFWRQHIKFRHRRVKHGTFCPAMNTRRGSVFRQLFPSIAPESTWTSTPVFPPAKTSLSTAATRFCGDDDALSHHPHGLN